MHIVGGAAPLVILEELTIIILVAPVLHRIYILSFF
jgi:hypothetical protein